VLVPLSMAAFQAFGLSGMVSNPADTVCGIAILFGTYFLLVLGPMSLASEGQALWIALTWPCGLERLLTAKAKLWAVTASAMVSVALVYAAWRFPADLGRILAVGVLWWVFARSLADKTVTLATVPLSSGEAQKVPAGQRWVATLGTFSFAIGVFTRQWSLAIAGVVYSILTAAAMWQNFRFRLPYLYDPWSEKLPPPPTLQHAMIGISAMVDGVSALSSLGLWVFGRDYIAPIHAGAYGLCAIVAALALSYFLVSRGVSLSDIWLWRDSGDKQPRIATAAGRGHVLLAVAAAAVLGAALGLLAHVYLWGMHWFPDIAQVLDEARKQMDDLPNARVAFFVMAVAFAPFAEEFLFRGLLYRALDREWKGWRAVLGAAAFFAIYHPALSWAPVAALGAMNAVLFKRSGHLAPAIAAHMAYNATMLAL
jgi:membrane protease YdiL (CAAX protease family)